MKTNNNTTRAQIPVPWIMHRREGQPPSQTSVYDSNNMLLFSAGNSACTLAATAVNTHTELKEALLAIVNERDSAALANDPAYTMIDRAINQARNLLKSL